MAHFLGDGDVGVGSESPVRREDLGLGDMDLLVVNGDGEGSGYVRQVDILQEERSGDAG